ncbi:MAG: ferritin-like domain-containing protein [Chloroflexi bacterium]|nr:ferritin-like domain-containing protein [Chloroflexota bacterium]
MSMYDKVFELLDFAHSRQNLVQGSTAGNIAMTNTAGLAKALAQGLTDVDILQFALTLEHLEARMYKDMLATNILTGKDLTYFQNFGAAEAAHVDALTKALSAAGAQPVQAKASYNFPAFNNRGDILNFAKTAEDIGVGAYQGAAAAISNKAYLAAAGSILQIEARHATVINILIGTAPVPAAFTSSLTVQQVLDKVNPILGS